MESQSMVISKKGQTCHYKYKILTFYYGTMIKMIPIYDDSNEWWQ